MDIRTLLIATWYENVLKVINGNGHSPRVLDALREIGVPEKYLFDPRLVVVPPLKKRREMREAV